MHSFERPPERAVLVCMRIGHIRPGDGTMAEEDRIEEAKALVESAGLAFAALITGRRDRPDASTFVGSGKLEELKQVIADQQATLIYADHALTAAQARNLERAVGIPVVDRTDLILDIFSQRAKSSEGKLQVELARLEHMSTRLVRGWTHLERQRGGTGLRGGPGETQLEIDRRLLSDRVKLLKDRLKKLARQRGLQRSRRLQPGTFRVAIVGYTNAGKSTLFNRLTGSAMLAKDQLFATLDTTTRRVHVADGMQMTVSDTVGFIRDLPHTLVDAFKSTLEEATLADLLVHVVDASNPARDQQMYDVNQVLCEIGAAHLPQLVVMNKIDRKPGVSPGVKMTPYGNILTVSTSALTGDGMDDLRAALRAIALGESSPEPVSAAPESLPASIDRHTPIATA